MLGGQTMYPLVANFLQCICAKNYENWLVVLIAEISGLFWPTLYILVHTTKLQVVIVTRHR